MELTPDQRAGLDLSGDVGAVGRISVVQSSGAHHDRSKQRVGERCPFQAWTTASATGIVVVFGSTRNCLDAPSVAPVRGHVHGF